MVIRKKATRILNGPSATPTIAPKFWNISSVSDDEGEIILYGEVVSRRPIDWWTGEEVPGLFISPEGFLEDLEAIKDKSKITVKLNSVGGDLYTGIAIHNSLKSLPGKRTVFVEGIAASAGSVIMCCGDDVVVYPGSLVMIHGVSGLFRNYYNIEELKQEIKSFDAAERAIAAIYAAKTGLDTDELRTMMTEETWMTGSEAVEKGFANTLLDGEDPQISLSADKKVLLVNGIRHSVRGMYNIPKSIPINKVSHAVSNNTVVEIKAKSKNGGKKIMNIEDLRNQHPDLVAEIENAAKKAATTEAIAAERARIQAIESIENVIGDKELIAEAKYGESPCTAAELSLKALQKQAKLGTKHLENTQTDFKASGAGEVTAVPNNGVQGDADDAQQIQEVVNIYKQIKDGGKE